MEADGCSWMMERHWKRSVIPWPEREETGQVHSRWWHQLTLAKVAIVVLLASPPHQAVSPNISSCYAGVVEMVD